jgi:hypothetical protein
LPSGLQTAVAGALFVAASLGAARAASAQCVTVPSLDPTDVPCATVVSVFGDPSSNFADPRRARVTIPWAAVVERPPPRPPIERAPIENGFEPPPRRQIKVDRELFLLLADLLDTNIAVRRYGDDLDEIRAWNTMRESEMASERATYLDVEEYMGHSEEDSVDAPWMTAGMSLTALSGFLAMADRDEVVVNESLELRVRPRFWPPGLHLKGTFSWP